MEEIETDEEIQNTLQKAFKPKQLSKEYRNQLLHKLMTEVDYIFMIRTSKDSIWKKPELWAAIATIITLTVIGYGVWLSFSTFDKMIS